MVTSSAIERDSIRINGDIFKVEGSVQQGLASRRPGKITIGDYTDASNPVASEWTISDFRDGIGVNRATLPEDEKRVWYTNGQIRFKNSFVLPRRAVQTAASATASEIGFIEELDNSLLASFGTVVYDYNNAADSWSSVRTLLTAATDSAVGLVGGTKTLVVATGSEVDYATDSSTWARNTTDIKYVVFWNDLLWGIDQAGQMYYTDDLSAAWTADAQLQLPDDYVTELIVARGADREQHIYAVTKTGLYIHDSSNARFVETDLQLPFHPAGGLGSAVFRGSTYVSAGNAVYQFQAGSDQTLVTVVGPDLDDGLPEDKRGKIILMDKTHNDLLVAIDSSGTSGVSKLATRASRGVRFHHGVTLPSEPGESHILGWNGRGWESKWTSGQSGQPISAISINNAYGAYRMWWGWNNRVYYMDLPIDIVNPVNITGQEYGDSCVLESSWVDFNIQNMRKLALGAILETINPSTTETVKVEYATNYVEDFTEVVTQQDTGSFEFPLPGNGDDRGVPFRAWKWRITLARGSNVQQTPQMVKLTLKWRPRIETLYSASCVLDLRTEHHGQTPTEMFSNLRDTLDSDRMIEVSWRADDTGEQTYLMDVEDFNTVEESGEKVYGLVRMLFVEPTKPRSR